MWDRWPRIGMLMLGLILATNVAWGQEGAAAPLPPWGESLEASGEASEETIWQRITTYSDEYTARFWVRPEFILGFIHSSRLPPLVTTGLTTDTSPGALGNPYTKIVYGANPVDFKDRDGFRITVGAVLNPEWNLSVEANYLTLGGRNQGIALSSPGNPIIARPFLDVNKPGEDSSLTTYPGFVSGGLVVSNTSYLQSEEVNAFFGLRQGPSVRVRGLVGVRHIGLRETLAINENSTITDATSPLVGQTVFVGDYFGTTNNFYAAQAGLTADCRWRRWTTTFFGKVALGELEERVSINGATTFQGATTPGGLLALSSNIGSYTHSRFGVAPEAGVNLQAALGKHVVINFGYSFLYLDGVVRPGYQVDLGVNPNLVPTSNTFGAGGAQRPAFRLNESDYWAHLFNFGLTIQY